MEARKSKISYFGIGIGAIALLLAIVHFWAGPFSPQPSLEQSVAEKAVSIKNATMAALRGEEAPPPSKTIRDIDADRIVSISTAVMGGLAIILGVVGFANRESTRAAGGAAVLGGIAIAYQFAIIAIGAIVFAILVAAVLSQLDFGIG
jgi:hypothetical protein